MNYDAILVTSIGGPEGLRQGGCQICTGLIPCIPLNCRVSRGWLLGGGTSNFVGTQVLSELAESPWQGGEAGLMSFEPAKSGTLSHGVGIMGGNGIGSIVLRILVALAISGCLSNVAQAEIGIVVYGSKSLDARRTESGHISLIVTDLCASGIDQVRECSPDEPPGVVITKYPNLAPDYDNTIFVVPLIAHFYAVDNVRSLPVLTSSSVLRALQAEYWRNHLKPYLPALSQQRHEDLLAQQSRFHAGKAVRELLTLNFLGKLLGGRQESSSVDSTALMDSLTEELIPNGSWREAIGARHVRSATIITVPAELDQELKLTEFIDRSQNEPFNTLSDNCSDFVKKGLLTVLAGKGMRVRQRLLDPADAWITSPLLVATSFLDYAKDKKVPLNVAFIPMLAGTGRPTASVKSIASGALVPAPNQGKLAFSLKLYINTLNPLIGTTAFVVDKSSGYPDLDKLVHERDGSSLSHITEDFAGQPDGLETHRRSEQVKRFGTSSCWKTKERDFAMITAQATEMGALTKVEQSKLLSPGRPFLLPRFYEELATAQQSDGALMRGVKASLGSRSTEASYTRFLMPLLPSAADESGDVIPTRLQLRAMEGSFEPSSRAIALRLMISVINYDLASEPKNRRVTTDFDRDWQLFLDVAERNGLRLTSEGIARENLEECSSREFEEDTTRVDAIQAERVPHRRISNWFRRVVVSPSR